MPKLPPPKEHQFKPGDDWRGNPKGRPKGNWTQRLKEAMEKENDTGRDAVDALINKFMVKALKEENFKAMVYIFDRVMGRIPQPVEVSNPDGSIPETIDRLIAKIYAAPMTALEGQGPSPDVDDANANADAG